MRGCRKQAVPPNKGVCKWLNDFYVAILWNFCPCPLALGRRAEKNNNKKYTSSSFSSPQIILQEGSLAFQNLGHIRSSQDPCTQFRRRCFIFPLEQCVPAIKQALIHSLAWSEKQCYSSPVCQGGKLFPSQPQTPVITITYNPWKNQSPFHSVACRKIGTVRDFVTMRDLSVPDKVIRERTMSHVSSASPAIFCHHFCSSSLHSSSGLGLSPKPTCLGNKPVTVHT